MDHATRRYLLFCDDDVTVDLDGVSLAIQHMQSTGAAVSLGRATDPTGVLRKRYQRRIAPLSLYNTGKAATYELLVDLHQVRRAGVRFDQRFGAGAPLHLGDEYIFIADLLRAGLRGYAVPYVFGTHPTDSSGSLWSEHDAGVRAAVFERVFGRRAPLVRLAFGLRHRRQLGGLPGVWRFARGRCPGPPAAVPDRRGPLGHAHAGASPGR